MAEVFLRGTLTCASVLQQFSVISLSRLPSKIVFDFNGIRFAEPSGVVQLHNLTKYLSRHQCTVILRNYEHDRAALRFMDDIGFFAEHTGHRVRPWAQPRSTTFRLQEVHQVESNGWINLNFMPWFAHCSGRPVGALGGLRNCLVEVFNNIRDHSSVDVGSIFAQWYPRNKQLKLCVGDFGRGIPANVTAYGAPLSPVESIIRAFTEGFSTGTPRNRGVGLEVLRSTITTGFGGRLKLYSGGGVVHCSPDGLLRPGDEWLGNSGYSGTLYDIEVPTHQIDASEPQLEDDIWN
ncbi:ATP-binding protein [Paracoccus liaowanqingii]|uniref:ATP-binding protein n=1 Tax=Paracoccus liaowanqingii TaxID=2560053 RepID=A0A4Z1C8N0_9RHOB|nr:ATP-binding protein [Paracoccus liaowanqingii]TGN58604.1 ATP-binding protein [Paracoccus liaowanqingii]